jgi:DNA-binding protein
MAEKYTKVLKDLPKLPDNEIRVKAGNRVGGYLKRANDIFTGKIEGTNSVVIKGVSKAMETAVTLAELIKHRVKGLFQVNTIENIEISDEYEPLEEGLDHLIFKRNSTMLTITLNREQPETKEAGY